MGRYHKYVFETDGRMVEVPADAFALLFAWCHTGSLEVPAHLREHPAWPAHNDCRQGHLIRALRPYAAAAFETLKSSPSWPSSGPSAGGEPSGARG